MRGLDTESRLIKKAKRADKEAADELISLYYREIYSYVYRQTGIKEEAMDLTQEIFIHMLQSLLSFDDKKASFRTWLMHIATYKVIDYYRSKHYRQNKGTVSLEDSLADQFRLEQELEKREELRGILDSISRLDDSSQQILRMKLFAGQTFLQISSFLSLPESTVKTRYYSLLQKIKKEVAQKE